MNNTPNQQKIQEFRDKMENFKFRRQQRAYHYQGIYIALLAAAIILFTEVVAGQDLFLKITLIICLIFTAGWIYKKMSIQAQKPIFVCENAIGTLEKGPVKIKGEDGMVHAAFKLSDFICKNDKKAKK